MPNLLSESKTPISSSTRKSVFLREWWLIKVERESKLGVGGFVNRETLGTRGMRLLGSASAGKRHNVDTIVDVKQVYGSAAIAKRHDNNTLEAVDGIIIRISGCINKSRTLSYGFSPEVCDGFLTGFPCGWEDYASKFSHDKRDNTTKQSLPVSFDDLPVTRVRDLLMSETDSRALTSIIFKDILKHTEISLNQSVPSIEKISMNSSETEVDHNQDDDVSLSNPTWKINEDGGFMSNEILKIPVDHNQDDVSLSNPTQKIVEENYRIPIHSHMETEDGGFISNVKRKITHREKQSKTRTYLLRSKRKRKNI